jgi:serine/threonine protein kinase
VDIASERSCSESVADAVTLPPVEITTQPRAAVNYSNSRDTPSGNEVLVTPSLDCSDGSTSVGFGVPRVSRETTLAPSEQPFDDFEILARLGEGAFATVYLARQVSLGRQVALKVSANSGCEARTLAILEHDHIVRVFSESIDQKQNLRLLCMQYVPGTTLSKVIQQLASMDPAARNGRAIIDCIDDASVLPTALDTAALRYREFLSSCDFVEAVCLLGGRLAEALAHAHGQGVLHRDIKPANILMNRYGRPLLADFNVSLGTDRDRKTAGATFGGTIAYMAPEHLDAFNPCNDGSESDVDHRADIYSLGVVLFELLTTKSPFPKVADHADRAAMLSELAQMRKEEPPSLRDINPSLPEILDRTVSRCLQGNPDARYQSAEELAKALEGCRELQQSLRRLPEPGRLTALTNRWPIPSAMLLLVCPHVLGSIVNIWYNKVRIVSYLTPAQRAAFFALIPAYNLIVYPAILISVWFQLGMVLKARHRLIRGDEIDREEIRGARQRALRIPALIILFSCVGWLPGGLIFPMVLHLVAGPIQMEVFWHFIVSFFMSGMIALTYSYFAAGFVLLRVFYLKLWVDAFGFGSTASEELDGVDGRLHLFQLLAGVIPLIGAILMISVGPQRMTLSFRVLVAALIILGMTGFGAAMLAGHWLSRSLKVLVGVRSRVGP